MDRDFSRIPSAACGNSNSNRALEQNRLILALSEICREDLVTEKWLIAPSLRVGQQWLDRVALSGQPVLNARIKTFKVLAIELAAREMALSGLSLVSNTPALVMLDRILDELGKKSTAYFSSLPRSFRLCSTVLSAITSLRLAGIDTERLDPTCFEEPSKAEDLTYILEEYVNALHRRNLVDYAEALKISARTLSQGSSQLAPNSILLIPVDVDLSALERKLLKNFPRDKIRYLPVDKPASQEEDLSHIHNDASLLRWLDAPELCPKPCLDGSADIFHATGEIHEVAEVLRTCVQRGHNLDEVELIYTDPDAYVPFIYETFLRTQLDDQSEEFDIPVTFADGIPARYSRPGRALRAWVEWIRNDYPQAILVQMIHNGLLELSVDDPRAIEFSDAANQLLRVGIGFGRNRYLEKLDESISELEQRIAASAKQADKQPALSGLAALVAIKRLVEDLLFGTKDVENGQREIVNAAAHFMSRIARGSGQFDNYSRRALLDRIVEIANCLPDDEIPLSIDLWEWLLKLPEEVSVAGSGPRPGRLHCANIQSGGHSGRKHTFIIGLDDKRFPGAGLNDPLLLDSERLKLSPDLSTASDQLSRKWEQFILLLARLRGTVTLGFSSLDLQEGRGMFPSQVILSAYRIVSGDRVADQTDLMRFLSLPTSFAPAAAGFSLDLAGWWLWRLCGKEKVGNSEEILRESFPDLVRGLEMKRIRLSDEFTIYDGFIPNACPELNPAAPSGPVVSAAMLETIGECPLKYFFKYVLRIMPPEEFSASSTQWLDPPAFGELLHEVLHQFMSELMAQGRPPSFQGDFPRLIAILEHSIDRYKKRYPPVGPSAFRIQELQLKRAALIFLAEEELLCRWSTPKFLEVSIGMAPRFGRTELDVHEPVILRLPNGQSIRARGRLDRVDEISNGLADTFAVYDYKSGSPYKYTQPDPYWQGRVIQHALYLRMAAALLMAKTGREAKSVHFEYFFPNMRTRGRRIRWRSEELANASEIIQKLCAIPGQGCFLPTIEHSDCTFCDYICICGDVHASSTGAKLKLENPANTRLTSIRELRQIDIDES